MSQKGKQHEPDQSGGGNNTGHFPVDSNGGVHRGVPAIMGRSGQADNQSTSRVKGST